MANPTIISAAPLPDPVRIFVPHPERVVQYFDRIRVYRSATIDGTFTEITSPGTRIPIDPSISNYEYVDLTGSSTDFYKIDYLDVKTGRTIPMSEAQQATGDSALDVLSVEELKQNFLFGLPLEDNDGNEMPDSFFEFWIKSAVTAAERRLDIPLRRLVITDEPYDFIKQDYNKFIRIQLDRKPVISVEQVRMVLPTDQNVITYDPAWIRLDPKQGLIQIVPGSGSMTSVALGLSAMWAPLVNGLTNYLPDIFRVDYTAGYAPGTVPYDIKEVVGKIASVGPLTILGDLLFGPGIAGASVSLDALMTNTKTTKDADSSAFAARIKQYRAEIREEIREIRRNIQGIRMAVA